MKKIILCIALVLLANASIAEAHQLSIAKAKSVARNANDGLANDLEKEGWNIVSTSVDSCSRITSHRVECEASVEVYDPDLDFNSTCDHVIRVKFRKATSRRTVVTFPGRVNCG